MESLLEDVSCLNHKQLVILRDTVDYLLTETQASPELATFIDTILLVLKKYHISHFCAFAKLSNAQKADVQKAQLEIDSFCNTVVEGKVNRFAAQKQCLLLVASYIKQVPGLPLSFSSMLKQSLHIEGIFDEYFPGYRKGGMAHILFNSTNKPAQLRRKILVRRV